MHEADYREIPLRNREGEIVAAAIVDEADYDLVSCHRWYRDALGYATTNLPRSSKRRQIRMHRLLLGLRHGDGLQADHINRDRLDNRRANLRVLTIQQQRQNVSSYEGTSSQYRGVSWDKRLKRWRAYGKADGVIRHLGLFGIEEEAAAVAAEFRRQHMPYSEEAR